MRSGKVSCQKRLRITRRVARLCEIAALADAATVKEEVQLATDKLALVRGREQSLKESANRYAALANVLPLAQKDQALKERARKDRPRKDLSRQDSAVRQSTREPASRFARMVAETQAFVRICVRNEGQFSKLVRSQRVQLARVEQSLDAQLVIVRNARKRQEILNQMLGHHRRVRLGEADAVEAGALEELVGRGTR